MIRHSSFLVGAAMAASASQVLAQSSVGVDHRGWGWDDNRFLYAGGTVASAALFLAALHGHDQAANKLEPPTHSLTPNTAGPLLEPPRDEPVGRVLDNAPPKTVTTNPEPATLSLLGTGLVGLAGFVKRRRRS